MTTIIKGTAKDPCATCGNGKYCSERRMELVRNIGKGCRDYSGIIQVRGLMYVCSCGYSDQAKEIDGSIYCKCGAIYDMPHKK